MHLVQFSSSCTGRIFLGHTLPSDRLPKQSTLVRGLAKLRRDHMHNLRRCERNHPQRRRTASFPSSRLAPTAARAGKGDRFRRQSTPILPLWWWKLVPLDPKVERKLPKEGPKGSRSHIDISRRIHRDYVDKISMADRGDGWVEHVFSVPNLAESGSTVITVREEVRTCIFALVRTTCVRDTRHEWSHGPCSDVHLDGREENQVHPSRSSRGQGVRRLSQEEREVRTCRCGHQRRPRMDVDGQEGKVHPSRSS